MLRISQFHLIAAEIETFHITLPCIYALVSKVKDLVRSGVVVVRLKRLFPHVDKIGKMSCVSDFFSKKAVSYFLSALDQYALFYHFGFGLHSFRFGSNVRLIYRCYVRLCRGCL